MMTKLIIEQRQAKKMTQKVAAKLLNVSRQKYNKMEGGKCTLDEFVKMTRLFNLTIQIIPSQYLTNL
jgi:DNA-binding XRE family transcriptional regulator